MAAKRGKAPWSIDYQAIAIRVIWTENQRALRIGPYWVCNWSRKLSPKAALALLAKVNACIAGSGCIAKELGSSSVGVQGDARVFLPCVYIACPASMSSDDCGKIAAKIINEVPGISKVLVEISPT